MTRRAVFVVLGFCVFSACKKDRLAEACESYCDWLGQCSVTDEDLSGCTAGCKFAFSNYSNSCEDAFIDFADCIAGTDCEDTVALAACNPEASAMNDACFEAFTCDDGQQVDEWSECDGFDDCLDLSDEDYARCGYSTFSCTGSGLIADDRTCNQHDDCADASDETVALCSYPTFACDNLATIAQHRKCDGFDDCGDGSDEARNSGAFCFRYVYYCSDGWGIDDNDVCDGFDDCDNGGDEDPSMCDTCSHPLLFMCVAPTAGEPCVPLSDVCDTWNDCNDGSDEVGCN